MTVEIPKMVMVQEPTVTDAALTMPSIIDSEFFRTGQTYTSRRGVSSAVCCVALCCAVLQRVNRWRRIWRRCSLRATKQTWR
jgi:hypothetical protein